ncbi:MAG TPA: hypothetical protein VMU85_08085 [Stellaceae bacterium]|nr:hypothetical protein [Stellaceae bacterium]
MKVDKATAPERALWSDRLEIWLKRQESGLGPTAKPDSGTPDAAPEALMSAPPPPAWPRVFPSL